MKLALDEVVRGWQRLGSVPPAELLQARLELHWAAQPLAAAAAAWARPHEDDGHTSLELDRERGRFVGAPMPDGYRFALTLEEMQLELLAGDGGCADRLALRGQRLEAAFAWLSAALARASGRPPGATPRLPDYDLPAHPVGEGAAFAAGERAARDELARWFGNAESLAQAVRRVAHEAGPVRCWPHHFDIATLLTLSGGASDEKSSRTIGVGLSPGDDSYDEPYFYVTPWPYPQASSLPALAGGGAWRTEGWVGAVLPASRLLEAGTAAAQAALACAHAETAIDGARGLLAAG